MTDSVHDDETTDAVSVLGMAKKVLADAESSAERAKHEALEEAHAEADQILQSAREESERLVADAKSEVERTHRKSQDEIERLEERMETLRVFEQQYNAGLLALAQSAAATLGVQLIEPHDDVEDTEPEFTSESPGFSDEPAEDIAGTATEDTTTDDSEGDDQDTTADDKPDGISFDLNDYVNRDSDS